MARQFISGLAVGAVAVFVWHAWPQMEADTAATNDQPSLSDDVSANVDTITVVAPDTALLPDDSAEQTPSLASSINGVRVDMRANTLSVSRRDGTLSSILNDITLQSGINFHSVTALRDEPVTVDLDAVPLEAGLRTLLAGYDAFVYYEAAAPDAAPQTVWIYAVGEGRDLAPVASTPSAVATTTDEPEMDLDALLATAGASTDETQRVNALQRVVDAGVVPPRDLLERILQNDQSDAMRLAAFRTLTQASELETTDVRSIADLALSDPNDELREEAQRLLADMNAAAMQVTPDQQHASSE